MPSLAETQKLLWQLISAPEGVAKGIAALPDRERRLPGGLEGVVVGDARLDAVARLDVYAGMYFFRIKDAIRENFPALADGLGETTFHDLCVDFLLAHPSTHFSLREVGRPLESFLRESPRAPDVPWAADLAAFEWAFLESFDAADAAVVDATALTRWAPEEWAALRFRFSPSLRVLNLGFAVAEAWRRSIRGEGFEPPSPSPSRVRLWRREHRVHHREVDENEGRALEDAVRGEPFGVICERVADRVGDEAAANVAVEILSRWIADELVVAIDR